MRIAAYVLPTLALLVASLPARAVGGATSRPCSTARCSCREVGPGADTLNAAAYLRRAEAVVLGTVVRHDVLPRPADLPVDAAAGRLDTGPIVARVVVQRRWKGGDADTLTVAIQPSRGRVTTCDYPLEVGHSYLVFAAPNGLLTGRGPEGLLATTICMGTCEAAAAAPMTRALDRASGSAP